MKRNKPNCPHIYNCKSESSISENNRLYQKFDSFGQNIPERDSNLVTFETMITAEVVCANYSVRR